LINKLVIKLSVNNLNSSRLKENMTEITELLDNNDHLLSAHPRFMDAWSKAQKTHPHGATAYMIK
jgi:hypothetical protein